MKKRNLSTLILILIFLVGLGILLYPTVSDWWNSRVQSRAIVDYDVAVGTLTEEDYDDEFAKADAYNEALNQLSTPLISYDEVEGYEDILNVAGTGIMGYLEIPRINVKLPIYHGTSESVLNVAVGHLEGTSLPVGGSGTHCVLSAHRGLPSAKLFTNLDKLTEGDTFTVTVLDRVMTYEVDQIRIVEPQEISELNTVPGEDYITLLTCTPYGINTHRLLVRGHHIESEDDEDRIIIINEAYEMDSTMLAPVVAAPLLLILLIILLVKNRKPKKKNYQKYQSEREENKKHE